VTKILFIDDDEMSFQIRKCIAKALAALPDVELFQAHDATEGLQMIDNVKPDVVVIDHEEIEEQELFIESLSSNHPPIVLQTQTGRSEKTAAKKITCIPKSDSLEGIHQTLLIAAAIAEKGTDLTSKSSLLH
jgi:chemotaxis response regulator CheB